MATFQLRGNRQWRAMIRRKGWPEQSRTFDTKADAERWARSIEGEMDRGIFVSRKEAESTTLGEALERYGKEVSALKKGAVQELSVVRMLSGSPLSRMYLAAIQGKDIAKYRDAMLADGYSPITIKRRLSVLSHLFTIATKEWGMEAWSTRCLLCPFRSLATQGIGGWWAMRKKDCWLPRVNMGNPCHP